MKKILLFLSLLLFSLSYSQDWKTISLNDEEAVFYKYNTDDTAWFKTVSEKTEYYPKNSKVAKIVNGYTLALFKFDCDDKKMGLFQMNVYSKEGKLLDHFEVNEILADMSYVVPETMGERYFNEFCNKEK
ncbi:hypothetical protein [Chryseobacterium sp. FH1]|uniref:hypothetical protein n=1 Tax=Chryseobacterium sp. FH1 TaxID=1233951 RepID=UPI0004E2AF8F|nr:hypothetical protein [Chryseobacterium sp. FH1]KFC20216.1 hypothetical protein IO90_13590 [Chryseobacterium sp. FH1]